MNVKDILGEKTTTVEDILGKKEENVEDILGPAQKNYGFERIKDIYLEEEASGRAAMSEFYEKPTGKTALTGALGALRWATSPLTAVARGAFREPAELVSKALGAPDFVTQLVGEAAEQTAYMLPYGVAVREAIKGGEVLRKTQELTKVGKQAGLTTSKKARDIAKEALEFPSQPSKELSEELVGAAQSVSKPVVKESIQQEVANVASKIVSQMPPDDKKRVGQKIIDFVAKGDVNWEELPQILKKYDMTSEEFAIRLKDSYTHAGRTLQRLSYVARQVKKELKDNPEAQKFLDTFIKEMPEDTLYDKIFNKIYGLERTRRGLLVSQLATTMRNIATQGARVTIGSLDDAFRGAIRSTVGGEGNFLKQTSEGLDNFVSFMHRFNGKSRKRLEELLSSENATLARMKMNVAPLHEVTLSSKFSKLVNIPNRAQEFFFRKIAFESKLTQLLRKSGVNLDDIDPSKIPSGVFEEAADYALEMTFATMPKGRVGDFIRTWSNQPVLTALLNPFPRFAFGNALPYLANFSPISFLRAMNPKVIAKLASGNPDEFAKHASRATLGILQLQTASWLRNSQYRGEKWYEIKNGDKYYDVRSYAPILSPYMLIAEAMSHPEKLKAADWAQAAIGLNRIAGTGLVLTDVLRTQDIESAQKLFSGMAGQYLGSFTVPFRTFQDMYASVHPESAIIRDTKGHELTGPAIRNIPVVSEMLPEQVSPIKVESPKAEYPLTRQLTGLSKGTKTLMEREVDDLNILPTRIYPRTGSPEADRAISKRMGPIIETLAPNVINNPNYKRMDEPRKRIVLGKIFAQARQRARLQVIREDPKLAREIKIESLSKDMQEILMQSYIYNQSTGELTRND